MSLLRQMAIGSVFLAATVVHAQAPQQVRQQVPGYYRLAVGEYEVTALFDGYNDLSAGLLKGLSKEKIRALLSRESISGDKLPTAFNAFLINTGTHLILVDSGAGHCVPETAGQLVPNIIAAGYTAEQVDTVLLTHLHLDHVCGLVDPDGKALFTNATVYASKAEADYWLDPAHKAQAPEQAKEYFDIATHSLAPYRAAGTFKTFVAPQSPLPEVQTRSGAGHTPASTMYRFTSDGAAITFIGDLIHNAAVQFAHPEVAIRFDTDPAEAIKAREDEFSALAKNGEWLAAAHLPFPGMGHVTGDGKTFNWVPVMYGPYQRAAHVPYLK
ncbi:MBL fold metallo-hydrolase [Pseudomonas sp. LS-2]|jgi:glyoxylase-like metal-dependent hydrolase (beta-lactamase superfamily II)|uniref:MBL fold metallo-hydrolase n=1 Tax=Pseudomonas sp. LS-2 TaxID=2315859 RepID=UPI000E75CF48|nr:MBL fold metallo-hydrolase [Pseudomonas sp. LS-2]RJX82588.1 MBL fold metallo-hydrolase [Pseudomonas sp. LS-2]